MVGNDNKKKVRFTDNDITEPINSNKKNTKYLTNQAYIFWN